MLQPLRFFFCRFLQNYVKGGFAAQAYIVFFGELSYEQIAKLEGCTKMAVKGSVDIAIRKLKKFFEVF